MQIALFIKNEERRRSTTKLVNPPVTMSDSTFWFVIVLENPLSISLQFMGDSSEQSSPIKMLQFVIQHLHQILQNLRTAAVVTVVTH